MRLDTHQMGIAEAINVCDENVLYLVCLFVFDTEGSCLDDVTVFHRGSSEKPGAYWGGRKGGSGGDAL